MKIFVIVLFVVGVNYKPQLSLHSECKQLKIYAPFCFEI